jgi:hypothetical protein
MINLYNQIETKGLYFYCLVNIKEKPRYILLKPGPTIEEIFLKYGKGNCLTLIYGDKNTGLGGINKMEKWMIRIVVFMVILWATLYILPYALNYFGYVTAPSAPANTVDALNKTFSAAKETIE